MATPRTFSLTEGGPSYRSMRRLKLIKPGGGTRSFRLVLFVWLPLALGEAVRSALRLPPDPISSDLSIHVRLLVALPVMLSAERLVDAACRSAINSLYVGGLCARDALDRIVARGERLRDAWWPELTLLLLGVAGGQFALWQVTGPAGLFHGETRRLAWSLPHLWYAAVALPFALFIMYRWLWRWLIWTSMLAGIARLPLAVLATHPDRAAGLSALARPVTAFSVFAFAIGAVLAGAWGTQLFAHRTTIRELLPDLLAFVLVVLAVALVPLLLFCGQLYRARRRELAQYGDFAIHYTKDFHDKWVAPGSAGQEPLGSPDIQSLADLGTAFEVVLHTRLFPFGVRQIVDLSFASLLPMVPLFANLVTAEQLLKRIVSTILGGFPL